ncbi:PIN domain-containing protein [Brevundimonas sp. LPMIX5]|uniref:PIN domain-containing protein n=1 Tax=Brevundimonas sp. LPMIX5 TaxID=2305887 RepID=UPI001313F4E5|nr:PIN domain-containing protein [Brevundimonas sp. LPMIX5]
MADRYYLAGPNKNLHKCSNTAFLFDANVWLSISGPYEDRISQRASAYSNFYKRVLASGGRVVLPKVVISEFVNKAVHMQAMVAKFEKARGVKIHDAAAYDEWIKEACDLTFHIVNDNIRVPDGFDSLDISACINRAEAGGIEFNDVLIAELCRRDGYVLVTDDADYSGYDIDIVTFNQRLA